MNRLSFLAIFVLLSIPLCGQTKLLRYEQVYEGTDGLAHAIDSDGKDTAFTAEDGQVGISQPQMTSDGQFAGWIVEQNNCCTSYPVATGVAIHAMHGKHLLGDGLMVYDWCFVPGKPQVAVLSGTVHGGQGVPNLHLYSARTGRTLGSSRGQTSISLPTWAHCLKQ